MDFKKILKIDGFKVFVIMILLIYPFMGSQAIVSTVEGVSEANIKQNICGIPFPYVQFEYTKDHTGLHIPKFYGRALNFVLDILIGYFIALLITIGYYKIKKK